MCKHAGLQFRPAADPQPCPAAALCVRLQVVGWRDVPVDTSVVGPIALKTMPRIRQARCCSQLCSQLGVHRCSQLCSQPARGVLLGARCGGGEALLRPPSCTAWLLCCTAVAAVAASAMC